MTAYLFNSATKVVTHIAERLATGNTMHMHSIDRHRFTLVVLNSSGSELFNEYLDESTFPRKVAINKNVYRLSCYNRY